MSQIQEAQGATYYVNATSGDDTKDGQSEANAWETISKVNGESFSAGDSILFKRGETWREQLTVPSSGSSGNPVTFSAYGTGANPIINGSDLAATWSLDSGNIWQATLTTEPRAVYLDNTKGTEQTAKANIDAANEWFWQNDVLYVYSTTDPDSAFTDPGIEAVLRHGIDINGQDYVTIKYLMIDKTNKAVNVDWKDDGDLIEGFEDTDDWTISGTDVNITADTNNYVEGGQSITLSGGPSGTGGFITMTKEINENLSDADVFSIAMYAPDYTIDRSIAILFSSETDWSKYFKANITFAGTMSNGWHRFVFAKDEFSNTGGESWSNTMIRLQIKRFAILSTVQTFDDLKKAKKATPICLLTFDDGNKSDLDLVEPILTGNGQSATTFVVLDNINYGHPNTLEKEDLITLQNAGWDISNHTKTHPDLTTLSLAELEDEVNGMRTWLIDNGFSKGADFLAYPGGSYDSIVINKVKERHKLARSVHFYKHEIHPDGTGNDFFKIRMSNAPSPANAQDIIDKAIERGQILNFLFHKVVESDGGYLASNLQIISDYLKTKEDAGLIQVMTYSEYWDYITKPSDIEITYNVIKDSETGIYLGGNSNNATVYNNTIYGGDIGVKSKSQNVLTKNNIASNQSYRAAEYWWGTLTENYNDWYGTSNGFTPDSTDLNQDPLFVDASNSDFHLQSSSPCIDTGTDVGLTEDCEETPVPQSSAPDIGAYEMGSVPTSPENNKTVGITPTIIGTAPASTDVTIQDKDGTEVAETTSDSNGNYRVEVSTALEICDDNSLTPYVGDVAGATSNIKVVSDPTTEQVPTITSPVEDEKIAGSTPTIVGKGPANQSVEITALDSSDNLITAGTGTVNADGNYSITCTTALPVGENSISVTINGVTSSIIDVTFVDPWGVVFDSVTNNPIQGAVVTLWYQHPVAGWRQAIAGTDIGAGESNPQTTGANGGYQFTVVHPPNTNLRLDVTANGYSFPTSKSLTSFPTRTFDNQDGAVGENFPFTGVVLNIDLPMDPQPTLLKISKDANKKEVTIGDIVTYTVTIENENASDVTLVYLEDKIPAGFKYISGKAILDNTPISDPTGNRPLTFNIGTVNANSTRTLKYQLVVGSGVTFGKYENSAWAKYSDGTVISNTAKEEVKVIPDPLFDLGNIIGKVFHDRNENGIQDPSPQPSPHRGEGEIEAGIANVQIATEDGTLITTDKQGKYHLPAIIPGRHLFRLDERTLPEGAYLTTEKVVIVDITPGILTKVNFGVKLKEGTEQKSLPFSISQDRGIPQPRLNVSLLKDEVIIEDGNLKDPASFRIFTNYQLFIQEWELKVLDKDTKRLVRSFKGDGSNIYKPIIWDGKDNKGKLIKIDRDYVYVLSVRDKKGREDLTREKNIRVSEYKSRDILEGEEDKKADIKKQKAKWIEKESKINNLEKQGIRIEGETIKVIGYRSKVKGVRIIKSGKVQAEIPAFEQATPGALELLEEFRFEKETENEQIIDIIIPEGEYDIEGKHIKVGGDYLFFVAMGDAKMGYTFHHGNIEPIQQDDKFREGFWSEGKLAYYLKGKIRGRYLITSSLDTERDKKELFRNLDPDKYYPVYGDTSSVDYKATATQGMLYLLIEWDKSKILWGNYTTGFTDTEFAAFNRTLYGGKLHYESVSTTRFSEPATKLIVFRARAQQRAAHNEFIGTGGSLFYLKHSKIIEGSEKLKIEVRDKITGLVLTAKEMEEGFDYEIDYSNGRLTFWQPISYIVESDSIISSHLLDGNPVYVVVDYEYQTKDKYDEASYGLRLEQSLTDYLRIGGTYVKEEQLDKNYELKGADTTVYLGEHIKLTGEYAETESEEVESFISTDGGLSFTELPSADADKGRAYGLKGEAYLFDRLGLTSYYKKVEKGFSSTSTTSQQGKALMGAGLTYEITPNTRLKVRHDIQKLLSDGNSQSQLQVGAQKTETTTAQITHAMERLRLTGEYRHQEIKDKLENFKSETNTEEDTIAVKADYKATEKITVSLKQQATLKGTANHQTTVGINAKVNDYLSVRVKETVGTQGNATTIGATSNVGERVQIQGDYSRTNYNIGESGNTLSVGARAKVNDYLSVKAKGTVGTQGTTTAVGATVNAKDRLELASDYTRTNYKTGQASDTASISAKAKVDDKTEVHTSLAITDSSEGGQTQSVVFGGKRRINEELEFTTDRTYAKSGDKLSQANTFGLTREKDGEKLAGTFTEQHSQSDSEVSNTNIFGLSGDINDRLAAQGSFERGVVQNHDGTQATRNAGSIGLGFVDKDPKTGNTRCKASSKLEFRFDDGSEDKRQYLLYNAVEGKVNPNTTLFAKANISQTENTTTNSTQAQYKELVTGVAYRPVNFDRLNLLAKYTYLEDDSPSGQSDFSDIEKEKSHTIATEAVYDLTDKWQLVEKLAYKQGEEMVAGFDFTKTQTWLMLHRLNYNIDRDWQAGAEYRRLTQRQAEDVKQGALVEVCRKLGEFIQLGAGYNFTDFNDDLTHLDYTVHGPFIRLTAKFYDRTPEEIERAREKAFERKIEHILKRRLKRRFSKEADKEITKILSLYEEADNLYEKGNIAKSKEKYEKILVIIAQIEVEERIKIDEILKDEDRINLLYEKANNLYRNGKLNEALKYYKQCLEEIENLKKGREEDV